MKHRWFQPIILLIIIIILLSFDLAQHVDAKPLAQHPTGDIPTVTSTTRGPYVIVIAITANETQINVRAGPNSLTE